MKQSEARTSEVSLSSKAHYTEPNYQSKVAEPEDDTNANINATVSLYYYCTANSFQNKIKASSNEWFKSQNVVNV